MAVNKVIYDGQTIIDLTNDTVTADTLLQGTTAHDKSGAKITGTLVQQTAPKLQSKTVTPTTNVQTVTPDSNYDGLSKVTVNAMPTATQATPSITVSTSGLITASATQSAGYVASGTKSATKQLTTQSAKTVTPTTSNQTAVASGTYTTGAITVKGDANLKADNIKSGVSIFGISGTYEGENTGGGGGDTTLEDGLITRTLTAYTNNRVSSIGNHAFVSYLSLTSVNFPQCKSIGTYAFSYCTKLTTISFPECTYIASSAFMNCHKLATASFPKCTSIGQSAFCYCSSLATISFPKCTHIGSHAFMNCKGLKSTSFPNCTYVNANAFVGCSSFLTTISFPKCSYIGSYAFSGCSKLTTIYLMASSLCSLQHSNAFSKTGIGSNAGSIFVPATLVNSYKTATNWAYFSTRIFAGN